MDSNETPYAHAVEILRKEERASVLLLQRRLRIGFQRANVIFDLLVERGVIAPNGAILALPEPSIPHEKTETAPAQAKGSDAKIASPAGETGTAATEPEPNQSPATSPLPAATPGPELGEYRMIEVRLIRPGPNPRTFIDPAHIAGLRASMKARGFDPAFPLIVRPNPDGDTEFEIACGECRWTSAKAESILRAPCCVRQMDDREMLLTGLAENVARQSISPIDEARGFEKSLAMGEKLEVLAACMGKTKEYVSHRRRLVHLAGTNAAKALSEGAIGVSHAEQLARLPSDLIDEVTDLVLRPKNGPAPMSVASLDLLIKDKYQREIRGSRFDPTDATLVPEAGACGGCAWNSKNIAAANGETSPRLHMCTNVACFKAKTAAAYERWKAAKEAEGHVVLGAEEAANIWNYTGKELNAHSGYVELNEPPFPHELRDPDESAPKWKTLLKDQPVQRVFVRDDAGNEHELVKRDEAIAAATANKHEIFKTSAAAQVGLADDQQQPGSAIDRAAADVQSEAERDRCKREKELAAEEDLVVWNAELAALQRSMEDAPKPPDSFAILLWYFIAPYFPDGRNHAASRRGTTVETFEKAIAESNDRTALSALIEVILQQQYHESDSGVTDELKEWAKLYSANLPAAAKQARKQLKADREAAAQSEDVSKGMKWLTKRNKAADFEWEGKECVDPDVCELKMPAGHDDWQIELRVARDTNGWHGGFFISADYCARGSGQTKVLVNDPPHYATRELAAKSALLEVIADLKKYKRPPEIIARLDAYVELITNAGKKGGK